MLQSRLISKRLRRGALVSGIASLVAGYFVYHAVYGEVGWLALQRVAVERAEAERALAEVRATNARLEMAIEGLRPDTLDPDAVETALRAFGWMRPAEQVILEPRGADPL